MLQSRDELPSGCRPDGCHLLTSVTLELTKLGLTSDVEERSAKMVRVACTMMQKDEEALLEPWLKYHGDLFGYENLFVFDNGSTLSSVIQTLEAYERVGVHLDKSHPTVADYAMKGEIIANLVRSLQAQKAYDVVFLMDCDEFVVLKDGNGATINRERILQHAEAMQGNSALLRVSTQFFNVINRPGEFARGTHTKTVVALDGTFERSDHGHHFCTTSTGNVYSPCEFAYVHYHYKPLALLQEHARAKLAPFLNVNDLDAVKNFTGPGHHLCGYLTMTNDEFQNWHKGDSFYKFSAFNDKLESLEATIPF